MFSLKYFSRNVATMALVAGLAATSAAAPQPKDDSKSGVRSVTVTVVHKDDDTSTTRLDASEFAGYRGDDRQQIVDVKGPSDAPLNVAVLIQDGLDVGVANEIRTIKEFISALPEGSTVMIGYLRNTGLQVRQSFTSDRKAAVKALRIPLNNVDVGSAPFTGLEEALRRFDGVAGRNQVVMISNGLQLSRDFASASPTNNLDLDRAISAAEKRGIPVWSIFANAPGRLGRSSLAISYGQGSLNRLADETGGKAFFSGLGFVTFNYALDSIAREMGDQYVITYLGDGKGKLEVTTESTNVKLRHAE